jgi:hypothetical protein
MIRNPANPYVKFGASVPVLPSEEIVRSADALTADVLASYSVLFSEDATGKAGVYRLVERLRAFYKTDGGSAYWHQIRHCVRAATSKIQQAYQSRTSTDGIAIDALSAPSSVRVREKLLALRWGKNFLEPQTVLAELRALPTIPLMRRVIEKRIRSNARKTWVSKARWRKRLNWALIAHAYLKDVAQHEAACREEGHQKDADHIHAGVLSLFDKRDVESIRALRKSGASIVFCGTHVGPAVATKYALLEALGNTLVMMVAQEPSATRIDASKDPTGAFFRVVKHLRQPGQHAWIDADGRQGNPDYQIDLFGKPVNIAKGAAHAVFFAKCQHAFCFAKWKRGGKIALEIEVETQLRKDEDINGWTARWMARYRELLIELLSGEPENMAQPTRVQRGLRRTRETGR